MTFLRSLSFWVLAMLAAGVAVGAAVAAYGGVQGVAVAETVEAVGSLWLNALRMTVIPLIVALLVTGVASVTDAASTGRLAARSILVFAVMLGAALLLAVFGFPLALQIWPLDSDAAAALIAGAGGTETAAIEPPTLAAFLATLVPANVVRAAAEDAVLPLVVFAVVFGFALTRLEPGPRDTMVGFFKAISDAMIVVVRWVLLLAPVGVFALSLGIGLRSGLEAAGIIFQYVVLVSAVTALIIPIAYVFAFSWGRASPGKFFSAVAPVQAVAFSTQSSIASMPLMVERARDVLGVPPQTADLVLPLAVAVFRMTSPVANLAVAFFVAAIYGIEPGMMQIAAAVLVAAAVSVGTVGLPGQASFFTSIAPICIALGVPLDILPILLAVEVIPDIFRTVGNVTADMAATVIAARDKPVSVEAA